MGSKVGFFSVPPFEGENPKGQRERLRRGIIMSVE